MPTPLPPIEHRFTSATAPRHTQKHPHGYLTSKLKRFLKKKIKYQDPETEKFIKGNVGDAIMWRYILNGAQGDNQAIEGILDRIEGKLASKNGNDKPNGDTKIIIIYPPDYKRKEDENRNQAEKIPSRISG